MEVKKVAVIVPSPYEAVCRHEDSDLASIQAVSEGLLSAAFIENPDTGETIRVNADNVDELLPD